MITVVCPVTIRNLQASETGNGMTDPTLSRHVAQFRAINVIVDGAAGTTPLSQVNWVGPVTGPNAGELGITAAAHAASRLRVNSSTGIALVTAQVSKAGDHGLKIAIARATKQRTTAWVCVISAGAPVSCSAGRSVKGSLTFGATLQQGQSIKLIAVTT